MSSKIHLRPAKPADLPRMINILIAAFSHGPWSALLFPAHLRTPGRPDDADQIDWRTRVLTPQLTNPGHRHIVAVERRTSKPSNTTAAASSVDSRVNENPISRVEAEVEEEKKEDVVVGWAHWYVASKDPTSSLSPEERRTYTERTIWGTPDPPGLDKTALGQMIQQGEAVEAIVDTALRPGTSRGDAVELHYLMTDPQHQRNGIGCSLLQEGLIWVAEGKWDGVRDVYLRSTLEGRGLYLSHGFEEVGEGTVFGARQFPMVKRNGTR